MMHLINTISSILLVVGAINWGLVGLLDMDLVQIIFGQFGVVATIVYGLVGLSGVHYIMQGKLF
jgi:uncharacterized membrane protein YuzA (DUF378 family)